MKPEGEIGLFREEGEVSEFLAFGAGAEIEREVAFADGVGASLNRNGLSKIAFRRIEDGQIVKRLYDAGMIGPQHLLSYSKRPLIQRLCIRIVSFLIVVVGEIMEILSDAWVF
jgi:hypothetical protein